MTSKIMTALVEAGGNRWQNYGKDRVYFGTEVAYRMAGGTVEFNKSGDVFSAFIPRVGIVPNNRAKVRAYYDADNDQVIVECWHFAAREAIYTAIRKIVDGNK